MSRRKARSDGGGASVLNSAQNGLSSVVLTPTNTAVELGGTLIQNTTIDTDGNSLDIVCNSGGNTTLLQVANGTTRMEIVDTATSNTAYLDADTTGLYMGYNSTTGTRGFTMTDAGMGISAEFLDLQVGLLSSYITTNLSFTVGDNIEIIADDNGSGGTLSLLTMGGDINMRVLSSGGNVKIGGDISPNNVILGNTGGATGSNIILRTDAVVNNTFVPNTTYVPALVNNTGKVEFSKVVDLIKNGRVATTGVIAQTITVPPYIVTAPIFVELENPTTGTPIGATVIARNPTSITVQFVSTPPAGCFINWMILS